jgi:hypothetical protein
MNNLCVPLIAMLAFAPYQVFSQSPEAKAGGLRPFQPGLSWRLESLSESERILDKQKIPAPATAGKGRILEENLILGNGFRRQVTFLETGEKISRFIRGNLIIVENKGEFFIESPDPDAPAPSSKGFSEFLWVAPEWKIGTLVLEGVECDIFARPWPIDAPIPISGPPLRVYAAIGREDGVPRRLEAPGSVQRYISSMTTTITELPDGAILALRRMDEAAKEMGRRYAIPQ